MKKEERILTVVSLLFAASVVFVFINALDVKLGLCGGGCPNCLCNCNVSNPGSVAPCGAVCSCSPACPAGKICDGAGSCVSCTDLGSNCGFHNGSCGNIIKCGVGGTQYCAAVDGCECISNSCVSCVALNTCVSHVCTPPGCTPDCTTGPGCLAANPGNAYDTGNECCGTTCYECDAGYSWSGGACVAVACVPACGECQTCVAGSCVAANEGGWCGSTWETCSNSATCDAGVYQHQCSSGSCTGTHLKNPASNACNGKDCGTCCICSGETPTADNSQDGDCGECKECGGLKACSNVTGNGGVHGDCAGADTYCCSGSCVNPPGNPSELGGACGSGDCAGGTWGCSGSDYECSSIGTECDRCSGDKRYDSVCDKDGACDENEHDCDACNTCQMSGTTASCAEAYEGIQDTVDPNLCNGADTLCDGGTCRALYTCGDNVIQNPNETKIGGLSGIGDEECDGTDNAACGGAGCLTNCVCNKCGNGVIDPGEICDTNGDIGCDSSSPTSTCSSNCSICTCLLANSKLNDFVFAGNFSGKRVPVLCVLQNLISYILKIIGSIFLLAFIIGGIYYMISGSNPEKQGKAKKTVTYAILGIVLTLISYVVLALIDQILV